MGIPNEPHHMQSLLPRKIKAEWKIDDVLRGYNIVLDRSKMVCEIRTGVFSILWFSSIRNTRSLSIAGAWSESQAKAPLRLYTQWNEFGELAKQGAALDSPSMGVVCMLQMIEGSEIYSHFLLASDSSSPTTKPGRKNF